MQLTSFDSHALIKVLMAEGLKEPVAEAIINAIKVSRDTDFSKLVSKEQVSLLEKDIETLKDNVATKADLMEVRNELKNEINDVKAELRKDIELIRKEMTMKADKIDLEKAKIQLIMWMGGLFVASTSIILGFLQYFAH